MPTGYTQVSASALKDATGKLVANATISFAPVSNSGKPISFRAGGGGQTISQPVKATVTNGAFTVQLADTTLSSPVNIGYDVTVIDNLTGDSLLGPGYGCVQPSGSTWSFDTYTPDLAAQVTVQIGPQGPQGVPGVASLSQLAATRSRLSTLENIFIPETVTANSYVNTATGAIAANSGTAASDFIPANSGAAMAVTAMFESVGGAAGGAFYDGNFVYLAQIPFGNTAGGTFNVPADVAFIRITVATAAVATTMVCNGNAVPASYQSPSTYPSNVIDAITNPVGTVANVSSIQEVIESYLPQKRNAFDLNAILPNTAIHNQGTLSAIAGYYVSALMQVRPGQQWTLAKAPITNSASYCSISYHDTKGNFVGVGALLEPSIGPNYTVTIPSGITQVRICSDNATLASQMWLAGASGSASYLPFIQPPTAASSVVVPPPQLALFGDSYQGNYGQLWVP